MKNILLFKSSFLVLLLSLFGFQSLFGKAGAALDFDVTNTNDSGTGSLRAAITNANANPGADIINFNIPGTGPHIITLATALPIITEGVSINGATEPDYVVGTPSVIVQGGNFIQLESNTSDDVTIDGLDLSGATQIGTGISIDNSGGTTTISNCKIANRNLGIELNGAANYTLIDNNLQNSGTTHFIPALYLNGTTGTLDVRGTLWGNPTGTTGGNSAIRATNVDDLTIGPDAADAIEIKAGEGLTTIGNSNNITLYIENGVNNNIHDIDMTRPDYNGRGIFVQSSGGTTTISNCTIKNYLNAINLSGSANYTLVDNNLQNSGTTHFNPALFLNGTTGTLDVRGTLWGNPTGTTGGNSAIRATNVDDLTIGPDAADAIEIKAGEGLTTMGNSTNITIYIVGGVNNNIHDLDMTRPDYNGRGIYVQSPGGTTTITNCTIKNNRTGIFLLNAANNCTLVNNNLQNSGAGSTEGALTLQNTTGTLDVRGTLWGNPTGTTGANTLIYSNNINNLSIGPDAADQIEILPTDGFNTNGTDYAININTGDNIHIHDLVFGGDSNGEGIRSTATNTTIENNLFTGLLQGINSFAASGTDINCNTFEQCEEGIQTNGTQTGLSIVNNSFVCNTRGIDNNNTSTTVTATNNYWGAADGSSTDGGSGAAYEGNVTATPFLTAANVCAPALTIAEILVEGNSTEIPSGDTSPMAADDTDFGTQATGSMTDHTFTIKNTGAAALNLTGNPIIAISGASEFTVETQPSASSIASGGADLTFVVRYAPTAVATHTATISINNDDCDENPYTFDVTGMGELPPAPGLDFDGTDDGVSIASDASFSFENTDAFTIEAQIKTTSGGQLEIVSKMAQAAPFRGYECFMINGDIYIFISSTFSSNDIQVRTTSGGFNDGMWHHIAGTYDGSSDASGIEIYVDGVSQSLSVIRNSLSSTIVTTNPLMIGVRGSSFGFFDGQIDEVRIWDDVRTEAEVQANMNCDIAQEASLVAYYRFNQGTPNGNNTGLKAHDYSGNNNCGILENFALTGTTSNYVDGAIGTCNAIAVVEPEIDVQGQAMSIPDGDTSPATADDTDFGTQATGSMTDHTFTIKNTGTGALNLTGNPIVAISGASEFTIATQPSASSIASGGVDLTFVVRYAPTAAATHTATISIANNDCDEDPYTFEVTGMGEVLVGGNALEFFGDLDDRVTIPDDSSLDIETGTVETWVYYTENSTRYPINKDQAYLLRTQSNNFQALFWIAGTYRTVASSTALVTNTWYHVAVTYDGASLKIYLNGNLEGTTAIAGTINNSSADLHLGSRNTNSQSWLGAMDEVRIWNRVLTDAEIATNYNKIITNPTDNSDCLVAYYMMSDGSGTTLTDDSGNGNTGTIGGNTAWINSTINVTETTITPEIVGTSPTDVCTSFSATIPANGNWTPINDGSGNPIMEINAPSGTDLGTVTVEMMRNSSIDTQGDGNGDELKIMPRYFHLSSSTFAANANFPSNVGLRFYFQNSDLTAMNAANMGDNGVTAHTAAEIDFTHYSGPNQDCDLSNNTLTASNVELIDNPTKTDYGCGNFYLETSVSHFSEFIAHEPTTQALLPVELLSFDAVAKENQAYLTWQTATEINNEGFFIQLAMGNEQLAKDVWETIGFVDGRGTTTEVQDYKFTHDRPANGTNYYRLKQMDFDGKFEYSDIKSVEFKNNQTIPVQIFPNPVKEGVLTIKLENYEDNEIQIQLYDLTGRTWLQQTSFDATTTLHVNDLAAGIYLIEIAANGQTVRQKIVIK